MAATIIMQRPICRVSWSASGGSTGLTYPVPDAVNDLFVATTGNDANLGTQASPLQTFSNTNLAKLSAAGHRRMWLRGGTYTPPATMTIPAGTSSNPIEILAYPGETVTINTNAVSTDGIDLNGPTWVNFWGLTINAGNRGFNSVNVATIGTIGFYYLKGTKTANRGDNDGILYFDSDNVNQNIDIKLCTFNSTAGSGNNSALIYLSQVGNFNVVGCSLDGSNHPIYQKHDQASTTSSNQYTRVIKNNFIRNANENVMINMLGTVFSNNLLVSAGVYSGDSNGTVLNLAGNFVYDHNTFYGSGFDWFYKKSSCSLAPDQYVNQGSNVTNNVFAGTGIAMRFDSCDANEPSDIGFVSINRNLYKSDANTFDIFFTNTTFANWKTNFAFDVNSIQSGSITFGAGWSSGSTTPSDWGITGPSVALTGSSTGGVIGVDTTKLLTVF